MRELICNSSGASLIGSMVGAGIGLIAMTAFATIFANITNQAQRVESRLILNAQLQEIQNRVQFPLSCVEMFGLGSTFDPVALEQSSTDNNIAKPGAPVTLSLLDGSVLESATATASSASQIKVDHLALTDRRNTGRFGPNGYPLYQVKLYGSFSTVSRGINTMISAKPIASLFLEINPAGNRLASCFGSQGDSNQSAEFLCQSFGGSWNSSTKKCEVQSKVVVKKGKGPLGTDGSVPKPKVKVPKASCGAGNPDGKIKRTSFSMSSTSGGLQQCSNGRWVNVR